MRINEIQEKLEETEALILSVNCEYDKLCVKKPCSQDDIEDIYGDIYEDICRIEEILAGIAEDVEDEGIECPRFYKKICLDIIKLLRNIDDINKSIFKKYVSLCFEYDNEDEVILNIGYCLRLIYTDIVVLREE